MPPSTPRPRQRGGRLLAALFWCGAGLAPVAAGTLLLGEGGGPTRLSALLSVAAIVLIGLSVGLRTDPLEANAELADELALARFEAAEADEAARVAIVTARTEVRDLKIVVDDLCARLAGPQAAHAAHAADPHTGQRPLLRSVPATLPRRTPSPNPARREGRPRHAAPEEPEQPSVPHNPVTYGTPTVAPMAPAPDPRRTRLPSRERRAAELTVDRAASEGWLAALRDGEAAHGTSTLDPITEVPPRSKYDTGQFWAGPDQRGRAAYAEPAREPWRAEERPPEVHFGRNGSFGEPYRESEPDTDDFSSRPLDPFSRDDRGYGGYQRPYPS